MIAYKIYDSDNDDFLELENFIDLFKDKALKNE